MPLPRFLINRDHARLWAGQAVSSVGDFVFDTTLVLWIATVLAKDRSWGPAAVSGVMLAVVAATVVVGPLAGVFVDRWDRLRTMVVTEVLRAVLVGGLAVLAFFPVHTLPVTGWLVVIFAVVFLLNAAGEFFTPSRFAVIGQVVTGDDERVRATSLAQATMATAAILGPPLAAPVLFTVGLRWALVFNALSYVFSYAAIRSVHLEPAAAVARSRQRGAWRREFGEGLRFFVGSRVLVALLGAAFVAQCGTGAIDSLGVYFATDNLHASPRLFGFVEAAFGVGAVVGSLFSARVSRRLGSRTTLWVGMSMTGLLLVFYSRQTVFAVGAVAIVAMAMAMAVLNAAVGPLLYKAVPQAYMGRVMAVFAPVNMLAKMGSAASAGWLASTVLLHFHGDVVGVRFGRFDTVFSVAGILITLSGATLALTFPTQKHIDKPAPDLQLEPAEPVVEPTGSEAPA